MTNLNEWIKKSIHIAKGVGYYDNLIKIYPILESEKRKVISKNQLSKLFQEKDEKSELTFFKILLMQEKFPIDDPYVAAFRRGLKVENNIQTVKRILNRVKNLTLEQIFDRIKQPPKPSRQFGSLFRHWLPKLGYPFLNSHSFLMTNQNAFLNGSDTVLKKFAQEHLDYHIDKGLDLVAKINGKYIIGEAKFLTDYGGTQNNQLKSALNLVDRYNGSAIPIAILDGVNWIEGKSMLGKIQKVNGISVSALLLKKCLISISK